MRMNSIQPMRRSYAGRSLAVTLLAYWVAAYVCAAELNEEWIDPQTGHRVIRLCRRDGRNSSFYFHQNPFTAKGDKMAFAGTTPRGRRIFAVDLKTLDIAPVTDRDSSGEIVAAKRRELFYFHEGTIHATHLDTRQTRKIADLDPAWPRGGHLAVNADETLLMGFFAEGIAEYFKKPRSEWFIEIHKARLPNALYTVDIQTGNVKIIHRENNWIGHVQFSPTDPGLVSFCHEGPWNLVDRIWTIRTDGTARRLVHRRTLENEIAGHEFWGAEGKRIWFDLQMPMGENFFLANVELANGKLSRYPLERDQWCVHYNISADGSMLCGDGGGSSSVARAEDGQWIYLFRPRGERLEVERLCSMADHDYRTEPNVRFTPDGRWVIFNSDINDSRQIHAVEVNRASPATSVTPADPTSRP